MFILTVDENKKLFSRKQVEAATKARNISRHSCVLPWKTLDGLLAREPSRDAN